MGFVDNRIVLATDLAAADCTALSVPVSGTLYDLGPAKAGSYATALAGMWLVVNCTENFAGSSEQRLAIGLSTIGTAINAGGDAAEAEALALVAAPSIWQYGNIDSNLIPAQARGLTRSTKAGQLFAIPLGIFGPGFVLDRYIGFWASAAATTGTDGGSTGLFTAGKISAYLTTSIPTNLRHMPDGIA